MDDAILLVSELGVPTAALIAVGFFVYKLVFKIVDNLSERLDTVDDKVQESLDNIEERLGSKLDAQHGILVALIDRVRSLDNEIIRQDTMIKTILGVPNLIDQTKISKSDPTRGDVRRD